MLIFISGFSVTNNVLQGGTVCTTYKKIDVVAPWVADRPNAISTTDSDTDTDTSVTPVEHGQPGCIFVEYLCKTNLFISLPYLVGPLKICITNWYC